MVAAPQRGAPGLWKQAPRRPRARLDINPLSRTIYEFGKTIKPVIFIRSLIECLPPGALTPPNFTPSRERGPAPNITRDLRCKTNTH